MFKKKPVQEPQRFASESSARVYSRDNTERYAQRSRQRRRGKRIKRTVLCTLVGVLLCGTVACGLWFAKIASKLNNSSVITGGLLDTLVDSNVNKDPFYMLLLGTDGRPGEDSYRSDSIILARIDPSKKQATLISIPRDTKVEYNGQIMKINATHFHDGAEGVVKAVNDLCGVKISHYAEINFDGMKKLIDAVGGIDLYIPEGDEVHDKDAGPVTVDSGQQHLNGEAALTFSRSRHQFVDGDYTRMRHQRMVLGALAKQILNNLDPSKVVTLVDSLSDMVITDLSPTDIASLVNAMRGMDVDKMYSANLPSWTGEDTFINGQSYVFVYEDELKEMMKRVDAGEDPKGPQTAGQVSGGGTIGDLSTNSNKDWRYDTAEKEDSSSSSDSSGSSSNSSSSDSNS